MTNCRQSIAKVLSELLADESITAESQVSSDTNAEWDSLVQLGLLSALSQSLGYSESQLEEVAEISDLQAILAKLCP